uniref:U3 small nucleolar ribonucleoprotein protein MPP10 n=1 Tax=Angiostrongylus cantonensis TaxID=6313 RepID=A0A0K0DKB7_ANGCA
MLKQTIAKLEEENLAPRSWELSGEVSAQQRAENELLEKDVQFDHGTRKAPEITELFTEKLEELIRQRIKDKAFDDVIRKKRVEERTEMYRNQAIEKQEMLKTSLAEIYEKEYQKADAKAPDTINEQHAAIEKQMRELFRLIDALSNFDYTPPEIRPEIRVVSNMPALRVEEVGMVASTDEQLLAPEEMKKPQKGDLKSADEFDRTDKLRQRRKKKNRQRYTAMVEVFGKEVLENQKKMKKRKGLSEDEVNATDKLKSSNFFTKLQETVRSSGIV